MAQRRMFSQKITDTDAFLDMPLSSQALYFHLCMHEDDDGFVSSPKKIMRYLGASLDEMKILVGKRFIIPFETGVCVIKHWRMHNLLRGDRYKESSYFEERAKLKIKPNGSYTLSDSQSDIKEIPKIEKPEWQKKREEAFKDSSLPYSFSSKIRNAFIGKLCPKCGIEMREKEAQNINYGDCSNPSPSIQHNKPIALGGKHELGNISVICSSCNFSLGDTEGGDFNSEEVINIWHTIGNQSAPQVRLGKVRLGKVRVGDNTKEKRFIPPTIEQLKNYCKEKKISVDPEYFLDVYTSSGWIKANGQKVKDWKATIRTWEKRETKKECDPYASMPKL